MKYLKMLGLLAVAAVAMMAFAGSASATLTEAAGDPVDSGDTIHMAGGPVSLATINVTCEKSTIHGHLVGSLKIDLTDMKFEECGNHTVTVSKAGSLSIESLGGGKGTALLSDAEITVLTHSLFLGTRHCIFLMSNTDIGTITSGTTATLSSGMPIPQSATDPLCGSEAGLTGSYTVNTPDTLLID